jgi:hypothetical protein
LANHILSTEWNADRRAGESNLNVPISQRSKVCWRVVDASDDSKSIFADEHKALQEPVHLHCEFWTVCCQESHGGRFNVVTTEPLERGDDSRIPPNKNHSEQKPVAMLLETPKGRRAYAGIRQHTAILFIPPIDSR